MRENKNERNIKNIKFDWNDWKQDVVVEIISIMVELILIIPL